MFPEYHIDYSFAQLCDCFELEIGPLVILIMWVVVPQVYQIVTIQQLVVH